MPDTSSPVRHVPGSPDRRARFEALAALVYDPLQRYVRRRQSAADADDVVADALLVCWRRLDDVPAGAELAWCYGVARRCLANHRRSADRQRRLVGKLADDRDTHTTVGDPAATSPSNTDPDLLVALAGLSDADRELVQLWAWEGLEPRELAVVLDTTANAVSIRLHRARRRLAERLAGRKDDRSGGQAAVSPAMEEEA